MTPVGLAPTGRANLLPPPPSLPHLNGPARLRPQPPAPPPAPADSAAPPAAALPAGLTLCSGSGRPAPAPAGPPPSAWGCLGTAGRGWGLGGGRMICAPREKPCMCERSCVVWGCFASYWQSLKGFPGFIIWVFGVGVVSRRGASFGVSKIKKGPPKHSF